jgi:hypothetical protein
MSATYNCFGLVFASRRTWIHEEALDLILRDDGYRRVDVPWIGDVVIYRDNDDNVNHVGIVVGLNVDSMGGQPEILVLSKWGADGEYLHRHDHVPGLFGARVEYWTERAGVT